jgi:hypothetical protein
LAVGALAIVSAAVSLQCGGGGGATSEDAGQDSSFFDGSDAGLGDTGPSKDASGDGSDAKSGSAILKGAIQKGPFVLGSSVQISAINSTGSPTGTSFNTSTTDDLGDFTVAFAYRGYVDMQASGFYYDEVTGALSTAPIVLHALYDVTTGGAQNAYINIVTHLAHDRAVNLMSGGMALAAAEAEAESELVVALGIGGTGFSPGGTGVNLNELGADNDQNAYLFAVSAIMVETVIRQDGTTSLDANLQELLDTIASDLAVGGTLPASVTSEVLAAEEALDVDLTTDLFALRLQSIGSSATPAVLDRAVDSDGDGYRNTIDTCPLVANPDQSVIPPGVLCSVTRHTTFLPGAFVPTGATPLVADFENTGHAGALIQGTTGWSWQLGDGTGRFAAPVAVTLPPSFVPSLVYDINKDGNLDLVGDSGWVPGDGSGHFGGLASFGSGSLFTAGLAVGDFTGDGLPDVAGVTSGGVVLLVATAPGVFGSTILSTGAWAGAWLFAVDVNHDGNLDLVAVGSGDAEALLGDGKGDFEAGTPVTSLFYAGAAVADMDGDGNIDVAVWDGVSAVEVAFGDGNGNFGAAATTLVGSGGVAVGDYNSDGKADLWIGYPNAPCAASVNVLLSQGRAFWPAQALHATPVECGSSGVLVSHDLNGDGTPDLVLLNQDEEGAWSLQGYVVGEVPDYVCDGTMCHGACVDTTSNFFNCSACGDACELGATCTASKCDCNGMDAVCNGTCVDKSNNSDNCSTCGNQCSASFASGSICQGGTCACPPDSAIACGGACVDESTDNNNCGHCGNACLAGQSCQSGNCECTPGTCSAACPCATGCCDGVACVPGIFPAACGAGGACVDCGTKPCLATGACGCSTTSDCPSDLACDTSSGSCTTACSSSQPCNGGCCNGGACATGAAQTACGTSGACVDCAGLATGTACLVTGTCGCASAASDCPAAEACDTSTSTCTSSCSSTQPCNSGCCSAATGGTCGTNLCSGLCVDELTDNNNCGGCGITCSGTCSGGRCLVILATGQDCPMGLAVDSTSVYWVNYDTGGEVVKVPIVGGSPVTLATGPSNPVSVVVNATTAYWTIATLTGNYVMSVPLGGGVATTFASIGASGGGITNFAPIALDDTSVYWGDYVGNLWKESLSGGAATNLASGEAPWGIAVDATNVYWNATETGLILSVPLDGGTPTTLSSGWYSAEQIVVNATSVFWTNYVASGGTLMSVPLGGGVATTIATGQNAPNAWFLTKDSTSLYWTGFESTTSGGSVLSVPLGGGTPTTIFGGASEPLGVAVDATSVYWADCGNGTISKVTPK